MYRFERHSSHSLCICALLSLFPALLLRAHAAPSSEQLLSLETLCCQALTLPLELLLLLLLPQLESKQLLQVRALQLILQPTDVLEAYLPLATTHHLLWIFKCFELPKQRLNDLVVRCVLGRVRLISCCSIVLDG